MFLLRAYHGLLLVDHGRSGELTERDSYQRGAPGPRDCPQCASPQFARPRVLPAKELRAAADDLARLRRGSAKGVRRERAL